MNILHGANAIFKDFSTFLRNDSEYFFHCCLPTCDYSALHNHKAISLLSAEDSLYTRIINKGIVNEISVCKSAIVLYSEITSNWPALKFPAATLRALGEKSVQLT